MRLIDADKLIYQSHAQHIQPYINKKDIDNAPTFEMAEDCISREEFERRIKPYDTEDKTDKALYNFAHNTLIGCPSVTPQPKRGHWIDQADSIGEYASGCYVCDECHEVFWLESGTPQDNEYNFCPNCGADMREVQDADSD